MTIGERIKELRIKKGLTQKQLANQTGLSEISIRKYESDERRPKIETIRKISSVLDSYIGYFLSGYYNEYADELAEDFSSETPQTMQIQVEDKYGEQIRRAITMLSQNPTDPNARTYAKKVLKDIPMELGYANERDFLIKNIMINVNDLNEKGLNKVLDLTRDLIMIKSYLVDKDDQTDKTYLEPVAAHERTDIEVTDEMRKHDDDIMDNDDFWK